MLYWDGTRYVLNKQGGINSSGDSNNYSGGAYLISDGTFYSLELTPDGGPYRGSYRNSTDVNSNSILGSWVDGGWTDTGTFHIDPASFTCQTEALTFDSYHADNDPDGSHQSFDGKNGAEHVKIWLKALRKEILEPNGRTLGDLGFTRF